MGQMEGPDGCRWMPDGRSAVLAGSQEVGRWHVPESRYSRAGLLPAENQMYRVPSDNPLLWPS